MISSESVIVAGAGPVGLLSALKLARGPYPTLDGDLSIVVYTNAHWKAFLKIVDDEGLMEKDSRFVSQESRTQNAIEIGKYLADKLKSKSNFEWLTILKEADIPASPVNSIEDLLSDKHLEDVNFFHHISHPTEGNLKVPKFPIQFSKSPASIRLHPPTIGENNLEFNV